jgi:hypothetical protein
MKTLRKMVLMGVGLAVATGWASAALGQVAALDPAVLAKANAGDAAAQVAAGDHFAQTAAMATDRDEAADNWKQAIAFYQKAADQGFVAGELHLADCYRDGRGVARDKVKAAEWYRKGADQGDAGAQGTLAMLYSMGQGVPQSDVEAYFWFDLAAAVKTANQDRYIANRQNVGTRITADELEAVQERVKKWKAAHPR